MTNASAAMATVSFVFNKPKRQVTFECWPRFANAADGDRAQFPGWPITVSMEDNDGRKPAAWLPVLRFEGSTNSVVQVVDDKSREVLYTLRVKGDRFQPPVFSEGTFTIRVGRDRPDGQVLGGVRSQPERCSRRARDQTLMQPVVPQPLLRVIKLGGSLLTLPDLRTRFEEWLKAQPLALNLLICGGGELVEAVRPY